MALTPEEKRIRIAELCGWKQHASLGAFKGRVLKWMKDWEPYFDCPDYLNDLNAMREAEKILTLEQQESYAFGLSLIGGDFETIHSDATRRANVFLLTLCMPND